MKHMVLVWLILLAGCDTESDIVQGNVFEGRWSFGCQRANLSEFEWEIELFTFDSGKLVLDDLYFSDPECANRTELNRRVYAITYYREDLISTEYGDAIPVDLTPEKWTINDSIVEVEDIATYAVLLERDNYLFLDRSFFMANAADILPFERTVQFNYILPRWVAE